MRVLILMILLSTGFIAVGQSFHTEIRYVDSAGKTVFIQSSLPKGTVSIDSTKRMGFANGSGNIISYFVFWTRLTNDSGTPLELSINFPAGYPSPFSYLKLFAPQQAMTVDKDPLFNYGFTDLRSFVDDNINSPTSLRKTIPPHGELLFYIVVRSARVGNSIRARLVLKEHSLFYNIRGIDPGLDSALIPCGYIFYKKS